MSSHDLDGAEVVGRVTIELLEGPTDNPLRLDFGDGLPPMTALIESDYWRAIAFHLDQLRSLYEWNRQGLTLEEGARQALQALEKRSPAP